ncbi:EamA family transporter [Nocardioides sp.]|uniref:EamA family transporter n=1 Tax=Nocardioides sp. TaxID=35761 RepID=UPI0027290390|nr:EamA family transporter [Nocardioides sp.]MDO9456041.1 EamA family transporter [Nocardioides sp.]
MAVLLSLCAALAYGLSDFVGGVASRRVSPWTIALMSQVGGTLAALVLGLVVGGDPTASDWGWAVLAGVGNGVGTAFLYRGLAAGRMGVVAPVSGVGAALVPLVVGLAAGERPGVVAWLGITAALPAIWLVAREPASAEGSEGAVRAPSAAGLVDGVLAGAGFGVLFAGLGQIPEESGFLPLAFNGAVGAVVVAVVAAALRQPWVPREPTAAVGLVSGALGGTATGLFLVATQTGYLTVAAVITSLYPAFTVLLAALLLRERVHRAQAVGLALCAVAVGLIAAS